jgi:hypothetical protein
MIVVQRENQSPASRIETLRKKIDNDEYLYAAIQRIAQVLSNELVDISQGGTYNERQRKGRK